MPPAPLTEDIVAVASGNEDFSTLVAALAKADLVDVLQGDGPFTVFAPSDAAFERLGDVVTLFVQADIPQSVEIKLGWGRAYVKGDENAKAARVTTKDVVAANGVVHVIDEVLLLSLS